MPKPAPFTGRHVEAEVILLCVRWYLRDALNSRDLEEIRQERAAHRSPDDFPLGPALQKRCRPHLQATTASWRVDETSVKVKGVWMSLYRAVASCGNTLEFRLSATRDAQAAQGFLRKHWELVIRCPPVCHH